MTTVEITATAYAGSTLNAPVRVLGNFDTDRPQIVVETLPGGVGGWATPGRRLMVARSMLRDVVGIDVKPVEAMPAPAPLTEPIDARDYMALLLARQAAWISTHALEGASWRVPPLLEWFVEDGDERFVRLPDRPAPKVRQPRVYRSAASLREERDQVEARMERAAGVDCGDNAVVNLSPFSRSRAARNAGRRRFAQLDRDLERYAALKRRFDALTSRILTAEAREAKKAQSTVDAPSQLG